MLGVLPRGATFLLRHGLLLMPTGFFLPLIKIFWGLSLKQTKPSKSKTTEMAFY